MAYQTFTHQIWWVMVCYDLAHQIRCAKHTFSGLCDIPPMVCCSFGGHSTPQFLQCSEIIVQKENQKVHEFLDQCTGHCLNAIVKDNNVDSFL